jgi:KDO2-lipid IV(A) lauroyltransferase
LSEVDAILAHGKGVLILSGHVGNWELFGFKARRMGYPVHVIVKEIKGRAVDDMTVRLRERFDIGLIPRQNSYRSCVRALRDNAMIAFMLDQNMIRDEGVFVDFFDRPACTSAGLAHLSALSGIPVVPVFCFREADGSHRFRAYPAIDPPAGRDEETIREATQAYTRRIEDAIREHPDQWIWIHRRWRTRPLAYADAEPQGPAPAAVPQGD